MTRGRLQAAEVGREQNELARDAYSLMHLPMVAGIVLVASGFEAALHHVREPLDTVPATALFGGLALYLLAHVAVGLRCGRTVKPQRLAMGLGLLALIPLARQVDAVLALSGATALLWAMIAFETTRFAQLRDDVRHPGQAEPPSR